jgi:hypothetical protein
VLATVALGSWWALHAGLGADELRSFAFAALVVGNVAMIHSTRARDRLIVAALPSASPVLWGMTIGTLAALAAALYVRPIADVFGFAPLSAGFVAIAAGAGTAGVLWYEAYKLLRPRDGARNADRQAPLTRTTTSAGTC